LLIILKANGRLIISGGVFFVLFFLRMIGDVVTAKPYEVNVLTGQIFFPSRFYFHNVGAKQRRDFYFSPRLGSQYMFVLRSNTYWLQGFFTYPWLSFTSIFTYLGPWGTETALL